MEIMEKLISMTQYVLENYPKGLRAIWFHNYAEFLSQKLELWMFVPCKLVDGVWVVFEMPNDIVDSDGYVLDEIEFKEYQEAKDRVLFEGFEFASFNRRRKEIDVCFTQYKINNPTYIMSMIGKNMIIEDIVKFYPTLTPTAQKQIGL